MPIKTFISMTIEDDINQRKFRNEHQKAAINLIYTTNWLSERMKYFFDNYDITSQQFNILRILRGAGEPLSTLQIRQRMLDKMSDTSRIVDRLVKKGMVRKNTRRTDRRLVDVIITDKGKKLLSDLDARNDEMDSILKNLDEADAKKINLLLDKLRNSV
jgi:DNA-binding MarR family transcriptional regulator